MQFTSNQREAPEADAGKDIFVRRGVFGPAAAGYCPSLKMWVLTNCFMQYSYSAFTKPA